MPPKSPDDEAIVDEIVSMVVIADWASSSIMSGDAARSGAFAGAAQDKRCRQHGLSSGGGGRGLSSGASRLVADGGRVRAQGSLDAARSDARLSCPREGSTLQRMVSGQRLTAAQARRLHDEAAGNAERGHNQEQCARHFCAQRSGLAELAVPESAGQGLMAVPSVGEEV